jgi:hypothetical protein
MTPFWISKALLWVVLTFPFGNAAMRGKIENFARALPKLSPYSRDAARLYVDRLGLVRGSPWHAALMDSLDSLEPVPPPTLRLRLVNDLARASMQTAIQAPRERFGEVRDILDRLLPK